MKEDIKNHGQLQASDIMSDLSVDDLTPGAWMKNYTEKPQPPLPHPDSPYNPINPTPFDSPYRPISPDTPPRERSRSPSSHHDRKSHHKSSRSSRHKSSRMRSASPLSHGEEEYLIINHTLKKRSV